MTKVGNIFECIGAITAAATRNPDFGKNLPTLFEDGNFHFRKHFFKIDGEEKASGTSANDSCLH